jgi:hypothetical protein
MPRQLLHNARLRSSKSVGCSASTNTGGTIARKPSRPRPALRRSSLPRCSVMRCWLNIGAAPRWVVVLAQAASRATAAKLTQVREIVMGGH